MSRHLVLAAMLWLAGLATALAQVPGQSLERAFETSTEVVHLPAAVPATLQVRGCPQCTSTSMELPATARFYVGNDEVTFAELRAYARGKRHDMVIFCELQSYVVRRIVVSGVLPKRVTN